MCALMCWEGVQRPSEQPVSQSSVFAGNACIALTGNNVEFILRFCDGIDGLIDSKIQPKGDL